ncbi:hypothetical protein GpartN1_g1996.t1 [Galdieria partita]|uniref:MINDY deubiquitinase domain-containing protein n=1 Tax=Galdieria partita TaxID=83374 RepID=A0A9C7PTJ2_9RHOD|nr:hypothetical protein GpartN1_g1996.t1 [Galdieria partita]
MSTQVEDFYRVKRVKYKDRNTAICLQNQNGPCPLLAIVNCLLLRGSIDIHADISYIAYQQLAELLTDYLFQTQANVGQDANLEQIVLDVVGVIPRLRTGIDVNVRFHSCESFEYTIELSAFDAFRVRLLHGWIIDPKNDLLVSTIDNLSYNQLVDFLVSSEELKPLTEETSLQTHSDSESATKEEASRQQQEATQDVSKEPLEGVPSESLLENSNRENSSDIEQFAQTLDDNSTEQENLLDRMEVKDSKRDSSKEREESREMENTSSKEATQIEMNSDHTNFTPQSSPKIKASIIREFLTETSNQLTIYGLEELHNLVEEDELCVFFRNNHFSTMTKHMGHLYLLISDIGFAEEKDIIWEKVCSIYGDSEFVNADFQSIKHNTTSAGSVPITSGVASLDEQLAAQLQAQESQQPSSSSNVSPQPVEVTDYQLAKKLQEEEQRKQQSYASTNRTSPSRNIHRTSPKGKGARSPKSSSSDKKSSCSLQ